jgi:protein-tyrosine phosphatase
VHDLGEPRRHIDFDRLHNFRDIGGYPTHDGRTVRWGRLYRADSLGKLAGDDWSRFQTLGVRSVIDLRYPWEIEAGGRVPEFDGLAYHQLSIEHRPYHQPTLDPTVDPARILADKNMEVVVDGAVEIRAALDVIASDDAAPIVVHCSFGKDRTGLIVALVLGLIGVADDDIIADYALTNLATDRYIADYYAHGHPPIRWPGYGTAPAGAMRNFLVELRASYGSIHGYASAALGIDDAFVEALRRVSLDPRVA